MKKLFVNTIIYGVAGSLVALVPLILLPYMTRSMSQDDYGAAVFFGSFVAILLPFMGFGATNALGVRYFQMPRQTFSSYLWSCSVSLPVSVFVACVVIWANGQRFLSIEAISIKWLLVGVVIAGLWGVSQSCGTLLIAKKKPNLYLLINATIGILTISITIISIQYLGFTWDGFAWGLLIAHLLAATLSVIILGVAHPPVETKIKYLADGIKFGSPIMVHSIAMSLISFFDRLVISKYLGVEHVAKYAVAFQLGILMSFIAQAFNKAFVPWLYAHLRSDTEASRVSVVRGTYLIFLLIIVGTGAFCLILEPLITIIAGPEFIDMYPIAVTIAWAGAFNAGYLMVVNYIFYSGRTYTLGLVSASVAIFFIVTSVVMTPKYGLSGASLVFLAANAALFLSIWWAASRCYAMPWFSVKLLRR